MCYRRTIRPRSLGPETRHRGERTTRIRRCPPSRTSPSLLGLWGEEPARITYHLHPGDGTITLRVYDTYGRERGRILDGDRSSGRGVVVWHGDVDGGRLPPGLYIVAAEFRTERGDVRSEQTSVAVAWSGQ